VFASLLTNLAGWSFWLANPVGLALTVFQIWMLIHALRQREWLWAFLIVIGPGLGALFYYFYVYRGSAAGMSGFELPGAQSRQRIRQLQAQIHHVDNAYHHFQLGDVYFQRGKLAAAEKCYRAALEREPNDIDTRAHLGQCLLRQKRPAEARPLLEAVSRENYKHDFGHTLMAYAETLTALNETDAAFGVWKHVVENNSYARAKVQFAELCLAQNQTELARAQLNDVIADDLHCPRYQRRRDRVWVRRARKLRRQLP
jgi:hypothetical protein